MNFLNNHMDCPIGNGGGTCRTIEEVRKFIQTGIAAIEIGSITKLERLGNAGNTFHSGDGFTLNSLGMPNGGLEYYKERLRDMIDMIHDAGKKAIVNVAGFTKEEYAELAHLGFVCKADLIVLNYGCPNIYDDGTQKGILSYDLARLKEVTFHVISENFNEAMKDRLGIKLSPVDPFLLKEIAKFLNSLDTKIGFITTQNTIPNCYDEEDGYPVISPAGGLAGMAGARIFPMALGQVKQFRAALNPEIKIIGVGGVTTGKDMKKMIDNGASLVQVVSAFCVTEDLSKLNDIGAQYLSL